MTYIFEDKKSPFFNFCRKFKLEAFDINELANQIELALQKVNIGFQNCQILTDLLSRLKGHPSNTMLVMQELYNIAKLENKVLLKEDEIKRAYEKAYLESIDFIEQCILHIRQKKHYHDVIYRLANQEKQILSYAQVYQIYTGLEHMGYLSNKERGQYDIIDGFLEDYLRMSI